ncbi:MAG: response regulator [Desulfosarcinaceae bacterium]|nr:response regulator [Desulfosarcinaceae bacterium]
MKEGAPHHILVIDDEKAIRDSFCSYLEDCDFRVSCAEDGQAGLALFRTDAPDLILVDLRMPVMDGLAVLETVHGEAPELPLIVVSGTGQMQDAVKTLQLGAWDYLLKPVADLSALRHAVDKALERAALLRQRRAYQKHLEEEVARRTAELEGANRDLNQINTRLRRLVGTTAALSRHDDLWLLGQDLLKAFGDHMRATGGSLYLVEPEGLRLVHSLDPGHAPDFIHFPLKEGSVYYRLISEGKPLLICHLSTQSQMSGSGWTGYRDDSVLAFPLPNEKGQIMGVLSLHGKLSPPFKPQDREVGAILAAYGSEVFKATRSTTALRESEERFRKITLFAKDAIIMMDVDGQVSFWNKAAEEIFGFSEGQALGRTLHDLIAPSDVRKVYRDTYPTIGANNALSNLGKHVELTARHQSGRVFPIELSLSALKLTGTWHLVGIIRDISRRKQTIEKLQASERKVRSYLDTAPDGIFVTTTQGDYVEVNQAACRMTGYNEIELLDLNLIDLTPPESQRNIFNYFEQVVQKGRAIGESAFVRKDRSRGFWTIHGVRLSENRFLWFTKDVTEERQLEKQLRQAQKMESIGTLAGGIAHDFNNILSSILGYTELTLAVMPEEESQLNHYVNAILKAGERARDLVGQILTFSRQGEQIQAPVQVHLILKEALKLLRSSLPATIEIRQKISDAGSTMADPTQIHQVIMNLCTNAYHAMEVEGGILNVQLTRTELDDSARLNSLSLAAGTYLKLTVSDTGSGMPQEVIDRIFDPYFTTKEKGKGTGLGLAVVHGIVKSHQGAIQVTSAPGEGSTFKIYLPASSIHDIPEMPIASPLPTGDERILLVDDEAEIVAIEQQMLERLGYRVKAFANSVEALTHFQAHAGDFDLVITDLTMPGLTGDRLTEELLKVRPDLPIILCTGFSEMMNEAKAEAVGITKFLMKPVSMVDFAMAVRQVLL